jgi:hypothetical protein
MTYDGADVKEATQACVTMPWGIAKALHKLLGEALANYEAHEGEIVMPKSYQKQGYTREESQPREET